jgi:hypothetical protein
MLGHARAADPARWRTLMQAINLSARTLALPSRAYRIGGGTARPLGTASAGQATDPCFFEGCGAYRPVASTLHTLWEVPTAANTTPLRLLVSDLEVNEGDISSLVGAIRGDLRRGASAGILALRLPFEGQVFDARGRPIHSGRLQRPVYLLATGEVDQVRNLLEDIRRNLAQKGVESQHLSILDAGGGDRTLTIRAAQAVPVNRGASGIPLRLGGTTYTPAGNPDYRFVRLNEGATGLSAATVSPWSGGTTRDDLGLVKLERIPLAAGDSTRLDGIRLRSMSVAGPHVRLEFELPPSTPSGLLRATIPQGTLPEQWWLEWDRADPGTADARQKTEGLLLLLTTLGRQVGAAGGAPPAVALCVAFQTR